MHVYTLMLPKHFDDPSYRYSNYMFSAEAAIGSCTSRYVSFFAKSRSFGVLSHSKGFLQNRIPEGCQVIDSRSVPKSTVPSKSSQVQVLQIKFLHGMCSE